MRILPACIPSVVITSNYGQADAVDYILQNTEIVRKFACVIVFFLHCKPCVRI